MIKLLGDTSLRAINLETITEFDDKLKELTNTMINTMYAARGRGLSANQLGVHKRIFVMDGKFTFDEKGEYVNRAPVVCINPIISYALDNAVVDFNEGCLSIPGVEAINKRYDTVRLSYTDLEGVSHEAIVEGLEAIIVQHEMEHLSGSLFIDSLKPLKRDMLIKRFEKLKRRFYARSNIKKRR